MQVSIDSLHYLRVKNEAGLRLPNFIVHGWHTCVVWARLCQPGLFRAHAATTLFLTHQRC